MRRLPRLAVLLAMLPALLLGVAACSGGSSGSTQPFGTPAGAANGTAVKIANGCSLLKPAEVEQAVGLSTVHVGLLPDTMGSGIAQCEYRATNGYIDLFVSDEPATTTPEQAVNRVLNDSEGERIQIPDVGDAAIYVNDTVDKQQTVVAVKTTGSGLRVITLLAYLQVPAQEPLVSLLEKVAGQV